MKENKEGLSKNFWYVFLTICLILITILIVGIVVFNNREKPVEEDEQKGADITLNYTNNISGLKLENITPVTDEIGKKNSKEGEYFDFSVEVKLDNASSVDYEVSVIKDAKKSTIKDEDIKIYLEKEKSGTYTMVSGPDKFTPLKKESDLGSKKGSMVLATTKKTNSTPDNYRLRIWLSDKSVMTSGNYSVEVEVNGKAK